MEEWKKIDGYENYSVSSEGRVRNDKTGRILKAVSDKKGYERVILRKNNKTKTFLVHRLVAIMFIFNPENKPFVDHIIPISNGGTNSIDNLRWVSYKENSSNELTKKNQSKAKTGEKNSMYGRTGEKNPTSKKVICITTRKIYESAHEAERYTKVAYQSIIANCRGRLRSAGKDENGNKLVWMYLDEYLESLK